MLTRIFRDKQGSALAIAFDGLYPCHDLVEAVLQPVEGQTRRILDLGTWIIPN